MYFAALLARTEDGWEASETELDDVEALTDLIEIAREASVDDETVLVFIEQEDAWFAVVRVDGEEDPRIYVSDAASASRSSYGEILLTDEMLGRAPADLDELVDLDGTEDGEDEEVGPVDLPVPVGPLGETELLADYGLPGRELTSLSTGGVPGEALSAIAESLGCAEVLEAVR
ncbi:hypothetical protein AQ490_06130 [Wenjunlia vitaminophila]|uniref:tRNA adenosine deaminase-associated protein n=1 Tax=Wenjunlia vitaminophila TaxID=76728 RepID=A0A0T6LN02_WENVI|nr:hypothetical protein [Wenjunlia vitaminophila]KRV47482.1 hypothetical protein AQ490_06130 [Wenjunlia vitaminophila]